ncbi:DNA ligase [Paenibacillus sp. FSL R7-0302]|uniref:DNA ligase n=1 Tax=Paenibacillus sp. FSL R7-0302 TaxID=2921681 RepID=UPI0030FC725C
MNIGSLVRGLLGDSKAGEAKSVELKEGQVVRGVVLSVSDSGKEAVVQIQGTPVRAELETPLAAGQTLNLQVGAPGEGGLPVLKPVSLGEAAMVSPQSMGEALESLGLANSKAGREIVQAMQAGGLAFTKETAAKLDAVMNAKPPGVPASEWLEAAVISVKRGLPVTAETVKGLQQAVFGPKLHDLLSKLETALNVWVQQGADGDGSGQGTGNSRHAGGLLTGGANAGLAVNTPAAGALPGGAAGVNTQAGVTGNAGTSQAAGSANGQAALVPAGDAEPAGSGNAVGAREGAGNTAGSGAVAGTRGEGAGNAAGAREGAGAIAGTRGEGAGNAAGAREGAGAVAGTRGEGAGNAAGAREGAGIAAAAREGAGIAVGARDGAGNAAGARESAGNVAGTRGEGAGNAAGVRESAGNAAGAREGAGIAAGVRESAGNAAGAREGAGIAAGVRESAGNAAGTREGAGIAAGVREGAGVAAQAQSAAGPALLAKLQGVLSELRGTLPQLAEAPPASGAAGGSATPSAAPPQGEPAATQGTDPWVGRILKLLGAEHEQQILRGGGAHTAAAQAASGGAEDAAGTLKGVLLQVLGSSETPPAVKEAAGQLVQQLTGQQLLLNTDRTAPFAQVTMFLPLHGPDGRETASVQIQSRRGSKGELDAANCRLWFDLDMKQLGQTMVDVQVVDRIVSLKLHNDEPWVLELLEGRREEMKAAVEGIGYQLSSLRTEALPERSVAAAAVKPSDYAPQEYKGVDYRI